MFTWYRGLANMDKPYILCLGLLVWTLKTVVTIVNFYHSTFVTKKFEKFTESMTKESSSATSKFKSTLQKRGLSQNLYSIHYYLHYFGLRFLPFSQKIEPFRPILCFRKDKQLELFFSESFQGRTWPCAPLFPPAGPSNNWFSFEFFKIWLTAQSFIGWYDKFVSHCIFCFSVESYR